jgi:quercetin dioxygenase-like cupin family protein
MIQTVKQIVKKNFSTPDETRPIGKGTIEILQLEDNQIMRSTFEPGWRWSESVKPIVGTDSCQVPHLMYIISGRMNVRMDDGSISEFVPGDMGIIPPGHEAWVVGDEPAVGIDFKGSSLYAKPVSR